MTKEEFMCHVIRITEKEMVIPTDEQYRVIEEVYMWHPCISERNGKSEVAGLYQKFGMTIFYDMLPRAAEARKLYKKFYDAHREMERIKEELRKIKESTVPAAVLVQDGRKI